jgi:DNA mismatch endonuclease (patch repair protein)
MADILTPEKRSAHMRRIRGVDTTPELVVRRLLHSMSYRFRKHVRGLPGRPDIVFQRRKMVVYVNGCFWHFHEGCQSAHIPNTRSEFWKAKFEGNRARDKRNIAEMTNRGWKTLTLWECEIADGEQLANRLAAFLGPSRWRPIGQALAASHRGPLHSQASG